MHLGGNLKIKEMIDSAVGAYDIFLDVNINHSQVYINMTPPKIAAKF